MHTANSKACAGPFSSDVCALIRACGCVVQIGMGGDLGGVAWMPWIAAKKLKESKM